MDCKQCRQLREGYFQATLSLEEKFSVELHLSDCHKCKRYFYHSKFLSPIVLFKKLSIKGWGIILIVLFVILFVGYISDTFKKTNDWWQTITVTDKETLTDIQKFGVGNRLNISSESNGIKMTITHILADDIQTFVYYQIEDQTEDRQLSIAYGKITSESSGHSLDSSLKLPMGEVVDQPEKQNIFNGKFAIGPISKEEEVITLEEIRLVDITEQDSTLYSYRSQQNNELLVEGNWSFTIPIKKEEIIEKELNIDADIAGATIRITKILLAPTATFIYYEYQMDNDESMNYIQFDRLTSDERIYPFEYISNHPTGNPQLSENGWIGNYVSFEQMYFSQPKFVDLHVGRVDQYNSTNREFLFEPNTQFPHSFTFEGTQMEVNQHVQKNTAKLSIEIPWHENRNFNRIQLQPIVRKKNIPIGSSESGIYVNSDGKQLNDKELPISILYSGNQEKIKYYTTSVEYMLHSDRDEQVQLPTGLRLLNYQVTSFPDQSIRIEF